MALALDIISRKFGFWTALCALVAAEMKRRRDARAVMFLDNATRRDIGLPEIEIEPNILWLHRWDGRL